MPDIRSGIEGGRSNERETVEEHWLGGGAGLLVLLLLVALQAKHKLLKAIIDIDLHNLL